MGKARTNDAFLDATEVHVTGPKKFSEKLSAPKELFQDVKVLAFRAERKNLLDDPYGKLRYLIISVSKKKYINYLWEILPFRLL